MTLGLDTSVVLRLLTGEPPGMAAVCRERLLRAGRDGEAVIVSDLVLLEAYHALQHHYGMPRPAARNAIAAMLGSGQVGVEGSGAPGAFAAVRGAGPADRMIHARYAACGARTLTFDASQARLPGAERIREPRRMRP